MRRLPGVAATCLCLLVAGAAAQDAAGQSTSSPATGPDTPGLLLSGRLAAAVLTDGDAEVTVSLTLAGMADRESLPLEALAFGGVPEEVTAVVTGGAPLPVTLREVRSGAMEGRLPVPAGMGDTATVLLTYRVPDAFRRGPDDSPTSALLALPWLIVPWAPADGAPGRVVLEVEFPGAVRLAGAFPSGFVPGPFGSPGEGEGTDGRARRWTASLPVLPALLRAPAEGPGASSPLPAWTDADSTGPGNPPAAPAPGLVFTGVFVAFGLVTVGYGVWMSRGRG